MLESGSMECLFVDGGGNKVCSVDSSACPRVGFPLRKCCGKAICASRSGGSQLPKTFVFSWKMVAGATVLADGLLVFAG